MKDVEGDKSAMGMLSPTDACTKICKQRIIADSLLLRGMSIRVLLDDIQICIKMETRMFTYQDKFFFRTEPYLL